MKKVVIISSTPRVNGNSEVLAKEFAKGATDAGNQVYFINLRDYDLNYCKGCYACKKIGKCIHNDGMDEIVNKILASDVLVLATPVYFYSMSGQLKVFIDRLVPVYEEIRTDIYMILSQWDSDKEIMENTVNAIRGCTRDCLENCEEKGALAVGDVSSQNSIKNKTEVLKKAYEMGKNC